MPRPSKPEPSSPAEAAYGRAFRAARIVRGLTQTEVAAHLGVAINTVRWHEAGDTLMADEKLARAATMFRVPATTIGFGHALRQDLVAFSALCAQHGIPPEDTPINVRLRQA